MSGAEASSAVSMETSIGLEFWSQITGFSFNTHTKTDKDRAVNTVTTVPFPPLPIGSQLAAELWPLNGFYNFYFFGSGPQRPAITPSPGPMLPGWAWAFDKGFMMIDQSVEYSPAGPSHKICVSFKANFLTFVEDITGQIIAGGFDPTTQSIKWTSDSGLLHGRVTFTDMALNAYNSLVTASQGLFGDFLLCGGSQIAPAGLDVFVGNYQYVLGGSPPCTFKITKTTDGGFECTINQLPGNEIISAASITYDAQMYLLFVPADQSKGFSGFTAMLGTSSNEGLVAYVMSPNNTMTGFIGVNEKPTARVEGDRLQGSVLWSAMLMQNAKEGKKKKDKKAEAAKKALAPVPTGVVVSQEIANAMRPFNGFYALNDTAGWFCIDQQVTYYPLKSAQKGVPQYTVQVSYQLNGSSIQQVSAEATKNFNPSTNSIKFGNTELSFFTQKLGSGQTAISQCDGLIPINDAGQTMHVTGTNSLTAPHVLMYAGNYCYALKQPAPYSLNLYNNNGAVEISITNNKTGRSVVAPQFTYDPQMFTVDIPAFSSIPHFMVMLGTVTALGCVAYILIQGKTSQENQIMFLSTNI